MTAERLPRLRPAELDETQRRLYDELVSGPRSRGPVPLTGADGQLEGPFNAAEQALGRAGLVELATLAGYYLTLAMIMTMFRVGAPEPAPGDGGPPAR